MGILVCPTCYDICENNTICRHCWYKIDEELCKYKQELEKIRIALKGYKDSNLASLAETLRARNEFLEAQITALTVED